MTLNKDAGQHLNTNEADTQGHDAEGAATALETPEPTPATPVDSWVGDRRYFQTGDKAGTMKPSAISSAQGVGGIDAETVGRKKSFLDVGHMGGGAANAKFVPPSGAAETAAAFAETAKRKTKGEKKIIEAKTGAKLAVRLCDLIVTLISKGQYGKDFTPPQIKERLTYRAALEQDWEDYLMTLDITVNPALAVLVSTAQYTVVAFETEAGKERAASLRDKVFGKMGSWLARSFFGGKK